MTIIRERTSSMSDDDVLRASMSSCYGESRSFTSTDGAAPAVPRVRRHDPYAVVSQPYRKEKTTVTWGVSHQPLIGSCFYIPFPKIRSITRTAPIVIPEGAVQLQIRQIRFEMETGQIRWLVRKLTGVHIIKADKTVPGVLNVWVHSAKDADRVCNVLHQNILFDFQGVFAPLNVDQKQALVAYLETRQFHTRSQRLPREPMSVTRMYAPPPPPPPQAAMTMTLLMTR